MPISTSTTSSSWIACPFPFIQMNPQDMAELKLKAGDLVEVYNDNGIDPGDGLSDADGEAEADLHAVRLSDRRVRAMSSRQGVNELIIPNYKQTWGDIRKLADAPENVRHLSFKSLEYAVG